MDPAEILSVRFHFGGEFVHIGKELDYVGGDEEISEIEREKMSLQEVIGFLKDHMEVKDSMKLYFLPPGKELVNGNSTQAAGNSTQATIGISTQAAGSFATTTNASTKKFKPPRPAAPTVPTRTSPRRAPSSTTRAPKVPTRTSPRKAPSSTTRAPTVPTRKSPRREAQSAVASSSIPQGATAASRGKKRLLSGKLKEYLTASGNY